MAKLIDPNILNAIQAVLDAELGSGADMFEKQDAALAGLREATKNIKSVTPGRMVYWPYADGRAHYIIIATGKTTCTLQHLPVWDAWESPVVDRNGKCLTTVLEDMIEMADRLADIFDRDGEMICEQ